jgi:hypothetical protein
MRIVVRFAAVLAVVAAGCAENDCEFLRIECLAQRFLSANTMPWPYAPPDSVVPNSVPFTSIRLS